eukprot:4685914-Prymnesium_polylepis.1
MDASAMSRASLLRYTLAFAHRKTERSSDRRRKPAAPLLLPATRHDIAHRQCAGVAVWCNC